MDLEPVSLTGLGGVALFKDGLPDDPGHGMPEAQIPRATAAMRVEKPDDDPVAVCCPHCHAPMLCLWETNRPSWFDVMSGPCRPLWYRDG